MGITLSLEATAYIIILGALISGTMVKTVVDFIKSPDKVYNFFEDIPDPLERAMSRKKPVKPLKQEIIDLFCDSDSDSDDYE